MNEENSSQDLESQASAVEPASAENAEVPADAAQTPKKDLSKEPHEKGTDEQYDRLGAAPVGTLLREFAIPSIAQMIISGLYNILTAIFLGWGVGDVGLAVSSVSGPMMVIFMAVGMLIGNGGNALAAIKLGEGKKDDAEHVLGNTFALSFIGWAILLLLAWVFIDPVLTISGAGEDTWELSKIFIRIAATGSILQILSMGINNFIRTAGDPNRALWSMLIGIIVDLACSALFVLVLGWGVPGQACAMVIGWTASTIAVLYYFTLSPKAPFKLHAKYFALKARTVKSILAMGFASFIMQAMNAVITIIVNNLVAMYGAMSSIGETGAFAMMAVIQRIAQFVMFPTLGIAQAAQPILGYNYGASQPQRVKDTLSYELKSGVIICTCMWVLIELFAPTICTWFGVSEAVLEYTQTALRLQTMFLPFITFQMVISNYYQATGRPTRSALLSLTRQCFFLIPLLIGLPIFIGAFFPQIDQLMGVVLAYPCSDLLSFILALVFVIIEYRSLNKVIKAKETGEETDWGKHPGSEDEAAA